MDSSLFRLGVDVRSAMLSHHPIVALESTVIAHGLPHPDNMETALACEKAVRETGAVPATISVFEGHVCVGCSLSEVERLATANLTQRDAIKKLSIRDLPVVFARKENGATTVATTVYFAARAPSRIDVFATGGIGGVHREWERTLDVSADLPALAQNDLVVVCAGAKSILDLPATREWLETAGITVVGYGTDEFPAFYSRSSGLPVDVRVDAPQEVAEILRARRQLGIGGAILVCVPVPEEVALPRDEVESAIARALLDAKRESVSGKALTPFLLSAVARSTEGRGLVANKALLAQNARVAGEIAAAITTSSVPPRGHRDGMTHPIS